jgi:multiple sugar transport system substrate-binding protein
LNLTEIAPSFNEDAAARLKKCPLRCLAVMVAATWEEIEMLLKRMSLAAFAFAISASAVFAGEIVLNSDQSDPAPKKAMEGLIDDFQKANPGITVKWNNFDHEGYKSAINNFLKANPPDVAAYRMAPQVKAGLFEDVTDVWEKNGLNDSLKSAAPSMTMDGKKWGVPYTSMNRCSFFRSSSARSSSA